MKPGDRLVLILKCGHYHRTKMGRSGYPQRRRCKDCRTDSVTVVHVLNLNEEMAGQQVLWEAWVDLEAMVQEYATAWREQATMDQ